MQTARNQCTHGHAVKSADDRMACQRAGAGGTADQLVPAEAQNRSSPGADEEAQDHGERLSGCDVF